MRKSRPSRRQVIGGLVASGVMPDAAIGATKVGQVDRFLRKNIQNVVVIYAENRSFNNLFAAFPGLQHPLSEVPTGRLLQRDRDGTVLGSLPPIWGGLVSKPQTVADITYQIGPDEIRNLENRPFPLRTPDGNPLPRQIVTRDLVHAFYNNQLQINGGRNDGFVAWGDSGALVMGHYEDAARGMRLAALAREFSLCDNFFMGAFGGSFLNHQYLIAAQPPFYPNASSGPASHLIAEIEGSDPTGIWLKPHPESAESAMLGPPKFGPSVLTPDFWAVNTMVPPYAPTVADASSPLIVPPQLHKTIGDVLTAKRVNWAWYAGAWQAALDGQATNRNVFPPRPNFQIHHQPFNYFQAFAPGTSERAKLRDGGLGSEPATNRFMADAISGSLPTVAFYKPEGDLNMHAGYSSVDAGDEHIAAVVSALRNGPQWKDMLLIITFDENGGWWDHVAPPQADRWGPGTRIPAVVISPHVKMEHVEHTVYDTGSIARFLTRRFELEKLPGLSLRERAMRKRSGIVPGDFTELLRM